MGESDFHAIGKARKGDSQPRMIGRQMFENFGASSDDGGLQLSDGGAFQSRGISEPADHTSGSGRQARVGFDLQVEGFGFSGHGC